MQAPDVCRVCGRRLPRSRTGIGPVCARRLIGPTRRTTAKSPARRAKPAKVPPAADALPGQDALPLFYMQPTLESL